MEERSGLTGVEMEIPMEIRTQLANALEAMGIRVLLDLEGKAGLAEANRLRQLKKTPPQISCACGGTFGETFAGRMFHNLARIT